MDALITKSDGTQISLANAGIVLLEFNPSSPAPIHSTETIDGRDGEIDLGTTYGPRKVSCSFYIKAVDNPDYAVFRDEVFALFDSRQPFYITESRNPGKRWKVKVASEWAIDQTYKIGKFDIDFTSLSPYAESLGSTGVDPITMDSDKWQLPGGGIIFDDDMIYEWSQNNIRIYNGGQVTIDPRMHKLIITFTGASSGLTITNTTTNDKWNYSGTTSGSDKIILDGVKATKNNESIVGDTNFGLITLAIGWNDIRLSGTSGSFTINFDFRFLYI